MNYIFIYKIKINMGCGMDCETNDNKIAEIKKAKNFLSPQLQLKMNFDTKVIIEIKELSNERIGILSNNSLSIYCSKTFRLLCEIEPKMIEDPNPPKDSLPEEEDELFLFSFNIEKPFHEPLDNKQYNCKKTILSFDENLIGFIELKNYDLVLWSSNNILIFKKNKKEYKFHQKIHESEETNEDEELLFTFHSHKYQYNINIINELKNGNLISGNSFGLILYTKDKNKDCYVLLLKKKCMEIEKMKEIESN